MGRCNYGTLSPSRAEMLPVMHEELTDEAVVVVKRGADEGGVTHWRIKLLASVKDDGDEGRNRVTVNRNSIAISRRLAE